MHSQAAGSGAAGPALKVPLLVSDLQAKQQLNRGYNDGLARGMEIVLTPLIFGGLGWLLDGWLGTDPFLAIGFGAFGFAGVFAKLKLGYDRTMAEVEAGKPWTRTQVAEGEIR